MRRLTPHVLLVCGWIALGLAVVGIVLPVLPTVPFVLLAAACFLRGSERWHTWLVSHPVFGPHISDYLAGRASRPRTKVVALITLWASVLLSVVVTRTVARGRRPAGARRRRGERLPSEAAHLGAGERRSRTDESARGNDP